jgi:hypothetical protein
VFPAVLQSSDSAALQPEPQESDPGPKAGRSKRLNENKRGCCRNIRLNLSAIDESPEKRIHREVDL